MGKIRLRSSNLLVTKWLLPKVRFIVDLRHVDEILWSQTNDRNTNYDSDESASPGVPTQVQATVNVKYLKCCTVICLDTEGLIRDKPTLVKSRHIILFASAYFGLRINPGISKICMN
jgi:hypothetical protein